MRLLLALLMAVSVDSRNAGTSSASAASLTWSHTVGAISNGILLVMPQCSSATGVTISSVVWDDGGANTALTRKGQKQDSGTGWAEIWYLLSPAPGTKNIKVTYSAAVACTAGSASYSGVDQATPFNAASPQSASGTTATATVDITSAGGELVIDSVNDNENTIDTLVVGGGQTTIHNITVSNNTAGASSEEAGAASVTMSWTGLTLSAPWAIIGVSLRPAAGLPPLPVLGRTSSYMGSRMGLR